MPQHAAVRQPPARRHLIPTSVLALAVVVAGIAVVTSGARQARQRAAPAPSTAVVLARDPASPVTELPASPAAAAAGLATALLRRAPAIVVAGSQAGPGLAAAAAAARTAHAPLLLAPAGKAGRAAVRAAVRSLQPGAVLAAGLPAARLSAELPGVKVVSSPGQLPHAAAPAPLRRVTVLVDTAAAATPAALSAAATADAGLAGATIVRMTGADPRADPDAITALAAARPRSVIAVGAGLGPAGQLSARLAVAETGTQLPGGGQVLFPGREIVALYGTPGSPALGVLGHQGLQATIARARKTAAPYSRLTGAHVVPAMEIIASVAIASPGPGGTYSNAISPAALRPWVVAAQKAGLYVTLDLQPGRAGFLSQAKMYTSLLKLPDVGLALDPEWKLSPDQVPLQQIGSVSVTEVNQVSAWLSALTARNHLPQKLFELHEFQLSMITGLSRLDTGHDNLATVINMDGQGAPQTKQSTWDSVTAAAPRGVYFGWKDFYTKDTPMLGPRPTIRRTPVPVLISYQ